PSVRWKVRVQVLGEDAESNSIKRLQDEIRSSPRVQNLLARRDADGRLHGERSPYDKWQGCHWLLWSLAALGYSKGGALLKITRDRFLNCWLDDIFYREFEAAKNTEAYLKSGVPVMKGRHRRCASQQGNALFFLTRLGLADSRTEQLVERLLH